MGTNFYELRGWGRGAHIGKRSAAGPYCWDCRLTLCKEGDVNIHYYPTWHDSCPNCGARARDESLNESSAGRELGFNKSAPSRKQGVASASSFTWGIQPGEVESIDGFVDEYGRVYTPKEFAQVLEECPIRYFDSIGVEFT